MAQRKPRPAGRTRAGLRTPALATAALTSVALLSQTAQAAPSADDKPSLEEVEKKVGDLYRRTGSATENYNAAKQQKRVDTLLDDVAQRTDKLNEAREELGSIAAAQYRTGASAPDAASPLLADDPQQFFDQNQVMGRVSDRQQEAADEYVTQRAETARQRQQVTDGLEQLTESQNSLKAGKAKVQAKLTAARELLSQLTEEEKARLAAIERREREEADREAEELARQQQTDWSTTQETLREAQPETSTGAGTDAGTSTGAGTSTATETGTNTTTTVEDSTYASKAAKALAFARAQIGKPYVWGATGPGSYDCSGLTQAAWKAAGVDLPRTTYDQSTAGTIISLTSARPGDLIFFYDNISHAGLYIGNGMMIHAPKPGGYVREESVFYDGEAAIQGVVRPA